MVKPVDTCPQPNGEPVARPGSHPAKDRSAPGRSAHGVATINVLSTAISRGKPPADPQTRSDFCFDRLLSFLPGDEHKLLCVYAALALPSAVLRKWASKGPKRLGEKVLARLEERKDAVPDELRFALDHPYVWRLGKGDTWARAGQSYDRMLRRENARPEDGERGAKEEGVPGPAADGASSFPPRETPEPRKKRTRNAVDDTPNTPRAHGRHVKFMSKKAAGIGPSPLGKFSSR
ncbi:hypothetical protein LX36DRAFT_726249 [Colletotrichum falcatum]|nr:hypothetical protein LX36DRAFT_726249 [Colletotrichum falcatum]